MQCKIVLKFHTHHVKSFNHFNKSGIAKELNKKFQVRINYMFGTRL